MNKKLITAASIALAACVAIGGTIAYLTAKTQTIKNEFTVGDVTVELVEPAGQKNDYKFSVVPGQSVTKDPKVTVPEDSESAYVFVKVEEGANFDTYFDYNVDTGVWKQLVDNEGTTVEGVYYAESTKGVPFEQNVLVDNVVNPKWERLKDGTDLTNATLSFAAYAIQKGGLPAQSGVPATAFDAWTIVSQQG